jgi:hypothetical protein
MSGSGGGFGGNPNWPPRYYPILPLNAFMAEIVGGGGGLGSEGSTDVNSFIAAMLAAAQRGGTSEAPTSSRVLAELPAATITDADVEAKAQCAVCLADFEAGEKGVVSLPCEHRFHREACLVPWLKTNHTCPTCRDALPTQAEDERGGVGAAGSVGGGVSVGLPPPRAPGLGRSSVRNLFMDFGGSAIDLGHFPMLGPLRARASAVPRVDAEGFDEAEMEAALRMSVNEGSAAGAAGGGGGGFRGSARDAAGRVPAPPRGAHASARAAPAPAPSTASADSHNDVIRTAIVDSLRELSLTDLHRALDDEGLTVPASRTDDRAFLVAILARKGGVDVPRLPPPPSIFLTAEDAALRALYEALPAPHRDVD